MSDEIVINLKVSDRSVEDLMLERDERVDIAALGLANADPSRRGMRTIGGQHHQQAAEATTFAAAWHRSLLDGCHAVGLGSGTRARWSNFGSRLR